VDAPMAKHIGRGKLIKREREERAWPQQQLADVADVSLRTIQRLERDGSASFETLMAVAQAFAMEVKDLTPASKTSEKLPPQKPIHLLPRLTIGHDLSQICVGADQFQVEHDEDYDPRSVQAMKGILELLKQDVVRLYDASPSARLDLEAELSQELRGLESYGYFLFGIRRVIPSVGAAGSALVSMATLYLSHSRSLRVVRDKALMVIRATLPDIAR
jgi:transcriptional regulator with XRE-family HTH domain